MANIQWNPQAFSPVRFDPSKGFAAAAKSFSNIGDQIQQKRDDESLAAYRAGNLDIAQQDLDYRVGAPARAIEEEERLLAKSAEQGILANKLAQEAGFSRRDSLFGDTAKLSEDERFRDLSGLQVGGVGPMEPGKAEAVYAAQDKFAQENKAAVSDPKQYRTQLLTGLLESGKFKRDEAETIANTETTRLFPTMSEDLQKSLFSAIKPTARSGGVLGTGSSRGTSGTAKGQFDVGSPAGRAEITTRLMENRGLSQTPGMIPFTDVRTDIGRMDATGSDIDVGLSRLASAGVVSSSAAEAAMNEAFAEDGVTIKDSYNWNTEKGFKKLQDFALKAQAAETQKFDSKTGGPASEAAINQRSQGDYFNQLDSILARGTTRKLSDEELTNQFLSTLGEAQPVVQQAPVPIPKGTPVPDVGNTILSGLPGGQEQITDPILANLQNQSTAAPAQAGNILTAATPQGENTLGINLEDIPESEGSKLFSTMADTVTGTLKEVPGVIDRGLKSLQKMKDASYGAQTKIVTEAIRNNGSLDGISGSDIKIALASKKLSPHEKAVIRKLSSIRKR